MKRFKLASANRNIFKGLERFSLSVLLFSLVSFLPTSAKAANILLYYLSDGGAGSDALKLATILTNAGNVVTAIGLTAANYDNPPAPDGFANWGSFDQVWDLRYVNGNNNGCGTGSPTYADYFTTNWSTAATNYLNSCGKFFTFMENAAFDGKDGGLYGFLNSVGATSGYACSDNDNSTGDNSSVVTGLPGAAFMFSEFAGGIPTTKLNGTAFATIGPGNWTNVQENRAIAEGWTGAQMSGLTAPVACRGMMFMVEDYSMWFYYPTANQGGFDDSTTTANFFSAAANWLGNTACNCNTPTFTYTPTVTNTFTVTPTSTFTPLVTNTFTSTSTSTATSTFTVTATSTSTFTATNTSTATFTPTVTSTFTSTNTPTITFTPTSTPTWTATAPPDIFYVSNNLLNTSNGGSVSIYVSYPFFPGTFDLWVYNSAGEFIKNLNTGYVNTPIQQSFHWDGTNNAGAKVASGVYLFYLIEPSDRKLKRMLLIR